MIFSALITHLTDVVRDIAVRKPMMMYLGTDWVNYGIEILHLKIDKQNKVEISDFLTALSKEEG